MNPTNPPKDRIALQTKPLSRRPINPVKDRFLAWKEEFNAAQTRLKDQLRGNGLDIFEALLELYCAQWRVALRAGQFASVSAGDSYPIISIRTNSKWLAGKATCSPRTVRTHMDSLESLGLLEKKFRGRQRDYEVWISRWILTGEAEKPPVVNLSEKCFLALKMQTSPPTISRTSKNNINSDVEMWNSSPLSSPAGPDPMAQEPQEQRKNIKKQEHQGQGQNTDKTPPSAPTEASCKALVEQVHEHYTGGAARRQSPPEDTRGRILERLPTKSEPKQLAPAARVMARLGPVPENLLQYVVLFWHYVKLALYQPISFSLEEERKIKNHIYAHVFNGFQADCSPEEWQTFYHELLERVDLASRYVERDPKRFIPYPIKYFDRTFESGFKRTDEWLAKQKAYQIQFKAMLEVRKAKKSLQKDQAPPGSGKVSSPLELYQYWLHRISRHGCRQATEVYLNYCATLNSRK